MLCVQDNFLCLVLGYLLLEIVLFVVLEIRLEDELLPPVMSWHLLQIVAFELLRSPQHLNIVAFLLEAEVLLEVRLLSNSMGLELSSDP